MTRCGMQVPFFPPVQRLQDVTPAVALAMVRSALGSAAAGEEVVIQSTKQWTMSAQVAERFSVRAVACSCKDVSVVDSHSDADAIGCCAEISALLRDTIASQHAAVLRRRGACTWLEMQCTCCRQLAALA